jgi:hypothetical protein
MQRTYTLAVNCYRGGESRDKGIHAQCEAKTDEEATQKLGEEVQWLRQFYDKVAWQIKQGDRVVALN